MSPWSFNPQIPTDENFKWINTDFCYPQIPTDENFKWINTDFCYSHTDVIILVDFRY